MSGQALLPDHNEPLTTLVAQRRRAQEVMAVALDLVAGVTGLVVVEDVD